jgi:hypothetical protein
LDELAGPVFRKTAASLASSFQAALMSPPPIDLGLDSLSTATPAFSRPPKINDQSGISGYHLK